MNTQEVKSEFRNLVDELKTSLISGNEEAVQKINDRMDSIEVAVKKAGESQRSMSAEEVAQARVAEFRKAHDMFVQGQRNEIKSLEFKHLGTKADSMVRFDFGSAGALLLPDEFGEGIIKNVIESTPILQLARVTRVNASNYKRRRRVSTPGGVWLGETVSQDKRKIAYDTVDITPHKWAARYGVSIEQEQDGLDLRSEIMEAFREDAEYDVGNAALNGDGVGKPTGAVGRVTNFDATQLALSTNDLIRMTEEIKDAYQANASWLFTRKTRAYIRTLILSATNGLQYTWEPNFQTGAPTLLLGSPVYIAREGDLAGRVSGAFTAGQVYAMYGDFNRGYEFAIRTDMYMIDDIYSEASSFERNFHIMTRIGGNVIQPEALVQITAAGA
jgi:HK97 family phage major capsid protein